MSRMPIQQIKPRAVRSRSALSPAPKREARILLLAGSEDAVEVPPSRPQGSLSVTEIETLRAAYAAGATGHLLIGLRQQTRLLTVMVPVQDSEAQMAHRMETYAARLRALWCDGYIHVRRVRLRRSSHDMIAAMLMEQYLVCQCRQQFIELGTKKNASGWLQDNPVQDAVSHALQRAFAGDVAGENSR